jgi:ABC-type dipeptide/oligopeptide/nickel transport system permease subunit
MKRKRKRIAVLVTAAILTIGILIGAEAGQTQKTIRDPSMIKSEKVDK